MQGRGETFEPYGRAKEENPEARAAVISPPTSNPKRLLH
jgi:hypothetical protein